MDGRHVINYNYEILAIPANVVLPYKVVVGNKKTRCCPIFKLSSFKREIMDWRFKRGRETDLPKKYPVH